VRVLFPSTIASFGRFIPQGALVDNEAPQLPSTMYGVAKVSTERLGDYYSGKGWIDFRAVRFPSVIGASRGPGGTTVYSTLMIQAPLQGKPYEAYVPPDTRLDIIYVKDAVAALLGLHVANPAQLADEVQAGGAADHLQGKPDPHHDREVVRRPEGQRSQEGLGLGRGGLRPGENDQGLQ
jgi:threonine 3-dehydrogenase